MPEKTIEDRITEALNNPPFETTTQGGMMNDVQDGPYIKPLYTIKVRQLGEYPETGHSFDSAAYCPSPQPCPEETGFWAALFGPTKAYLTETLLRREAELKSALADNWELRRQVTELQSKLTAQSKTDDALRKGLFDKETKLVILTRNLNAANEEIMRMTPVPKKRGRPKKVTK